jgi:hypothetical protein
MLPDEGQSIKQGTLYKLTSGHDKKWEPLKMLLTDKKISYSIDTNASKAWNTLGLRVAESIPLLDIENVSSTAGDINVGLVSRLNRCMMYLPKEIDKKLAEKDATELLRNTFSSTMKPKNRNFSIRSAGLGDQYRPEVPKSHS